MGFVKFCAVIAVFYVLYECNEAEEMGSTRHNCPSRLAKPSPTSGRVDTTKKLEQLRHHMQLFSLDAYIVTSNDEHQNEDVQDFDKRRQWISGFSGSNGDVVITQTKAALWTDGRYHIQADNQLSCDWLLMRDGELGVPSFTHWLTKELSQMARVGVNPKLISSVMWDSIKYDLENSSIQLIPVNHDLIDSIWKENRPPRPKKKVYVHGLEYAGEEWESKLARLRKEMKKFGADAFIVTMLDEIAWLLNIRGEDYKYSPVVRSYAIITLNLMYLYIDSDKIDDKVKGHLRSINCMSPKCVQLKRYEDIWSDLQRFQEDWSLVIVPSPPNSVQGASQAIVEAIPMHKRLAVISPIKLMKARKNPTEIAGMERAHIRDAVAVCDFLAFFEDTYKAGQKWTELRIAEEINRFRKELNFSRGLSFSTIVGFGPHGASPHHEPSNETNLRIHGNSTVVIDSGGQYFDGTTDVTRTLHMGEPTAEQKEMYTRVLIGTIHLSTLVFPETTYAAGVDVLARQPLWLKGLDYAHGTGHGIGAFLNVHESPIDLYYDLPSESSFGDGFFLSNEPGYYKKGDFGVRLENILRVMVDTTLPKHISGNSFLRFKDVTLVPYEPKLMDGSLLTPFHRNWLNEYNGRIRNLVGNELKRQKRMTAFYWMMRKTKHIPERGVINAAMSEFFWGKLFLLSLVIHVYVN